MSIDLDVLRDILMRYFNIGDSYTYELTRVKEAFEIGTMSVGDFTEWNEDNIDDLVNYIRRNMPLFQSGM